MSMLITIPMIALTATILFPIFTNLVGASSCLYAELCLKSGTFVDPNPKTYYYVDYPAARLACVSS